MVGLPVEYTPLTQEILPVGMEFEPVQFRVREKSHEKSLALLKKHSNVQVPKGLRERLFPSELWSTARVISRRFGRMNEVAASGSSWELFDFCAPGAELVGETVVVEHNTRSDLPFVTVVSTTKTQDGCLLARFTDEILLLHGVAKKFYTERRRRCLSPENVEYRAEHEVYFRFPWDEELWRNNIHTDRYAQEFGFEAGLPEFVVYMDWSFLPAYMLWGESVCNCTIFLEKVLPVYVGERVEVVAWQENPRIIQARHIRDFEERVVVRIEK